MKKICLTTQRDWRDWLSRNHNKESAAWLVFFKKHTGKPTLEYDQVVEEALCFGWIDSIIKKLDDEKYARKFTPRKTNSRWSKLNKLRVNRMTEQGRMTKFGLAKVEAAKKSGLWDKTDRPQISYEIPEELKRALKKNSRAKAFFEQLAPTYRRHYIAWIQVAKRQETKNRRVKEAIASMEQGKKLGLR
jgi:uncharacterized protein YdeI (YjbR/CyaY-like superfamily)